MVMLKFLFHKMANKKSYKKKRAENAQKARTKRMGISIDDSLVRSGNLQMNQVHKLLKMEFYLLMINQVILVQAINLKMSTKNIKAIYL